MTDVATTGRSAKVIRFLGDRKQGFGVADDTEELHRLHEAGLHVPQGAVLFHHMDDTYLPMRRRMHPQDSCPTDGRGTLGGPVVRA